MSNNKIITKANDVPMTWGLNHLGRHPPSQPRKVVSQVFRPSRTNALGHTRVFSCRAGWPSSHAKFHKLAPHPGMPIMSQLSLSEMHSGGEAASDLMSSCLVGHLWCKCDLILFLTGVGSAQQCLQVAVLALLVLNPWWCLMHWCTMN